MDSEEKEDTQNWLLTNVPEDIRKLVKKMQDKKKAECGCRYGRAQAIFNLLRKYCGEEMAKLPNACKD